MKKFTAVIVSCLTLLSVLVGCGQVEHKNDEYDKVLMSGDGYEIVAKWTDSFETSGNMIGVLRDGKWLYPLSDDNIFLQHRYLKEKPSRIINTSNYDDFKYCSDGMFRIENCFYDVYNNTGFIVDDYELSPNPRYMRDINFEDGYTVVNAKDKEWGIYRLSRDGEMYDLGIDGTAAKYSNGVFYCEGIFYDINGNKVIDITDLSSKYKIHTAEGDGRVYFARDGKCYLYAENDGGTTYLVVINRDGSREEPQKVESKN